MNRNRRSIILVALLLGMGAFLPLACKKKDGATAAAKAQQYTCPMHPQYVSDKPGDCPICHMRLVPKANAAAAATPVSGQATVQVDPERQQLIGVKVSPVEARELFNTVRAAARVAYDPGLYSALLEHREALQALKRSEAGQAEYRRESQELVRASALRLRQLGLSEGQIQQAASPGFDPSSLLLGSPGQKVWVYIDVFDYEARQVKPGQRVLLTATALPGKTFEGKVRSVDTVVNPETRTLRARAETSNAQGELKPDMYLAAVIEIPMGKQLAVPTSAIVDTGMRRLVYVAEKAGHYVPREVELGREAGGYAEVIKGLKEGDQVVTSGNFLIDSESRIQGSAQ